MAMVDGRVISGMEKVFIDLHPEIPDAVPGSGPIPSRIMLVGKCPPHTKAISNEPMGSKSAVMLEQLFSIGSPVYVTNLAKTPQPFRKKLKQAVIKQFYPGLREEIRIVGPKRILAMGTDVAKVLCPGFDGMKDDHGTFFYNPELKAYVIPTWEFSSVRNSPENKKFIARDLQRIFTLPDPEIPPFKTVSQWKQKIPQGAKVFLDIETDWGGDDDKRAFANIIKIGVTVNQAENVVILQNPTQETLRQLYASIKEAAATVIGQGLVFDLANLMWHSKKVWHVDIEDTMVMAHVLGEEYTNLKHLSVMYTDRPGSRAFGSFNDDAYNAEDVHSTREIYHILRQRIDAYDPWIIPTLFRLVPHIAAMQYRGVYIDRVELSRLLKVQRKKVTTSFAKLNRYARPSDGEINWNSPDQVVPIFKREKVKLTEMTPSGKRYTITEPVLEKIADQYPIVKDYLQYQEETKYLEFLEEYTLKSSDDHPILHPKLKMTGTRTGRFSMSNPNLQQVPRVGPIKTLYRSRWAKGRIGLMDLSGAELRIVALLSGDEAMVEALLGPDFHADVAASVYQLDLKDVSSAQRKKSKGVTFGILYGGKPAGLAKRTNSSEKEVTKIYHTIFVRFPKLKRWISREEVTALRQGYGETIMGRRRNYEQLIHDEGENSGKRKAVNTPVQGTASDTVLCIMDYVQPALIERGMKTRILLGIHDAILLDIYPGESKLVIDIIAEAFLTLKKTPLGKLPLYGKLPMVGEMAIGESWATCESTNENYNPIIKAEFSSHKGLVSATVTAVKKSSNASAG